MEVTAESAKRRNRLRFRSWHRGTREIDLLLGSFADLHLSTFSEGQVDKFEALLEENDPDIYDWITGMQTPPDEHQTEIMDLLRRHQYAATKTEAAS